MKYPMLTPRQSQRQTVDVFRGYNHNLRIGDGEFYEMRNMTGDRYPVLSPRRRRGALQGAQDPQGMIAKDSLCYVDGSRMVINGYPVEMGLSTLPEKNPKQLVSMGAYIIILPDKKWVNSLDTTQQGNIEAAHESQGNVSFTLCKADGTGYDGATVSPEEPSDPENLDLWIDTSETPHSLKQYSSSNAGWTAIASTYVRIAAEGIGEAFGQYDGVTVSGITANESLNGSTVIWDRGDDYIVIPGIVDTVANQDTPITVERRMPDLDFVTESGNRLWGCKYGMSGDQVVNEIYACKLGDFKNWSCYMGLSTDSYTASCGSDGPFTGAITHLGYPLFFKESFLHKVYGSFPANFQIQGTPLRGVQRGCHNSLAIVGETLYYKSPSGVCGFDGSLPVEVSSQLGDRRYDSAAAGSIGSKYYISMRDVDSDSFSLFVYDTAKGMWHREDELAVTAFCGCRGELYAISGGELLTMLGSGVQEEPPVEWMVQTGKIGLTTPDMKYISRLHLRMQLEVGSIVEILARYDFSRAWEPVCRLVGDRLGSFSVPIRPKRCDYMELMIQGEGPARIYSLTKTLEQGSDRP